MGGPNTDTVTATPFPVGQKETLAAFTVPAKAVAATLELDSSWHTDPDSIAVWGLDISRDGGSTWEHLCTVTRGGGPAFTDGGAEVSTFHVECPMLAVDRDTGKVIFDARGQSIRPFLGVLKGSDSKPITPSGTLTFR